jgi:PAS domain S-box-containing protein
MIAKPDRTSVKNKNPVLNVDRNGCVLYSNEAGEPLLYEWGAIVGEKLPSNIGDRVQRVISQNSPEKMEIKAGNRIFLVVFSPLPKRECVNISGFDISEQKNLEEEFQLLNEDLDTKSTELCKVNEALRKSESKYWHFIENAQEGIWILDHNDRTIFVNKQVSEMLGYNIEEIIGQSPQKFLAPNFCLVAENRLHEHRQRVEKAIDYRFIRKDGSDLWSIVSTHQLFDDKGKYTGSLGMLIDITGRKKAEQVFRNSFNTLDEKVKERTVELEKAYSSLKEIEKGYAEAQKIAHIGNWDWDLRTGEVYWSDEMYRIFERNPQEQLATYTEFLNYIHPNDRDNVDNTNRKGLKGEPINIDYRIVLSSGEERTVHTKAEVIFDEASRPIRLKGIVQDITERKRVEEKLKESEERYRNIVETANEGIGIIDDKAIITYANRKLANMLGYTVEDGIGLPIWNFIGEECKNIVKMNMEKRLNGINESYEYKLMHKDNSPIWVYMSAKPLFDDTGKFMGIMSMFTDITKRKEAEEALNNIEIARKKEIHHRIKNNLQILSSLLDLQAEQFKNRKCIKDSEVLEAFKESKNRVKSMALIHEELHKGCGNGTLNFSQYIVKLIDNLFLTYRLGNTGISLDMDIEEKISFDMDTSVPLGIIVNELVSNSLKHAFSWRDNGEIRIKFHREEKGKDKIEDFKNSTFTLSISDNGLGIPEEIDIKNPESLGLQLVTTLVEQVNGELELKKYNGTEFIMRFTVIEK